ncbi:flagellar hook-length control protein FliK [Legionella clemsonensis]|uniref:Flagellar hook-length control protein FliK n=1 Tax=Legionella clemsonensis TaxID=1867846 RepID=A0A222NZH5_9GAMM|nr:flagellar hook-length control protein FliK [Legionella clemsonensis]ASQ44976.1 Flagellar hook-length control protein FliK [Legionella clemsonensis]
MAIDMPNNMPVRLEPMQELKLTKPSTELYVGQILKTVVVKALSENQVLININGQNINARTSHHINPDELLQVKVVQTEGETVLQILRNPPELNLLHKALMQTLPKQSSPAYLLASLSGLSTVSNLPPMIRQQIQHLLTTFSPVAQLPQQLAQAIGYSGLFWENTLVHWRKTDSKEFLTRDFKGQCIKLSGLLNEQPHISSAKARFNEPESFPLLSNVLQPPRNSAAISFTGEPVEHILTLLRDHTMQTLARVETNQLLHLLHSQNEPYRLLLELPLHTLSGLELIPLKIEEHRQQQALQAGKSSWSMSFAIHLSHLGDIQAKVKLQDTALEVQINADKKETVAYLTEQQQTFANLLESLGLTLTLWNVDVGLLTEAIDMSHLHLLDMNI